MTPSEEYCLIPLTQGQFAKVSAHRFEELSKHKWQAFWNKKACKFYARRDTRIDGERAVIWMHRYVLGLPARRDFVECDHINHDPLDNRDENLRAANRTEQVRNRGMRKDNRSGYKGVYRKKWRENWRWCANICVNGKRHHIKYFPFTEEGLMEAAKDYDVAAVREFGEFAVLNFPHP